MRRNRIRKRKSTLFRRVMNVVEDFLSVVLVGLFLPGIVILGLFV